jgi:hypothetical protein
VPGPAAFRLAVTGLALAGRHGSIGIVLDDRVTGAVWPNARAHALVPAASTMKLAVVADLLLRNRRGGVHRAPATSGRTNTLTQIASILFQGHHTAAPHPQPSCVP